MPLIKAKDSSKDSKLGVAVSTSGSGSGDSKSGGSSSASRASAAKGGLERFEYHSASDEKDTEKHLLDGKPHSYLRHEGAVYLKGKRIGNPGTFGKTHIFYDEKSTKKLVVKEELPTSVVFHALTDADVLWLTEADVALTDTLKKQEKYRGCYVYFRASIYRERKLFYIKTNGIVDEVKIKDSKKFEELRAVLMGLNDAVLFKPDQVNDLVIANTDHTPDFYTNFQDITQEAYFCKKYLGIGAYAGDLRNLKRPRLVMMPLIEGTLLSDFKIKSPAQFLKIVIALIDAISFIHANGDVHGDLKANNIFLQINEKGQYKVIPFDFTLMRKQGFLTYGAAGSYLAPELKDSISAEFNQDVFSVGTTIEWLLANVDRDIFYLKDVRTTIKQIYEGMQNKERPKERTSLLEARKLYVAQLAKQEESDRAVADKFVASFNQIADEKRTSIMYVPDMQLKAVFYNIELFIEKLSAIKPGQRLKFLKALGEGAVRYIVDDVKRLATIVLLMPEESTFLFLEFIGKKHLIEIINDSAKLLLILKLFSPVKHLSVLQLLASLHLRTLFPIITDLENAKELLSSDQILGLLGMLGKAHLVNLIQSKEDRLIRILLCVEEKHRLSVLQLVDANALQQIIDGLSKLEAVAKKIAPLDVITLFELLNKDHLLNIINKDQLRLSRILDRLHNTHRLRLLKFLTADNLRLVIDGLTKLEVIGLQLPKIEVVELLEFLGKVHVKNLIANNPERLSRVLNCTDAVHRLRIFRLLDGEQYLQQLLATPAHLNAVLKLLPENNFHEFLTLLGIDYLKRITDSIAHFDTVLNGLDPMKQNKLLHGFASLLVLAMRGSKPVKQAVEFCDKYKGSQFYKSLLIILNDVYYFHRDKDEKEYTTQTNILFTINWGKPKKDKLAASKALSDAAKKDAKPDLTPHKSILENGELHEITRRLAPLCGFKL